MDPFSPPPSLPSKCSSRHPSPPPPLVHELAEIIAVHVLRLQAVATLWQDRHAIAQPLNVLSRSTSPSLTKAALIQLPHIDLDFASIQLANVDLLEFMYTWFNNKSDPKARPLQFRSNDDCPYEYGRNPGVIDLASGKGLIPVLSWWIAHSPDLFVLWTEAAIDEASANGDLQTLNWWFHESGLPHTRLKYSAAAMDQASAKGMDHVFEWWLKHSGLSKNQLKYSEKAMGLAAANGHWTTLQWWMSSKLSIRARDVMDYAASRDRIDMLEWCLTQPKIMRQTWFGRTQQVLDLVSGAIGRGNHSLLVWFDGMEQLHGHWDFQCWAAASMAAASMGDIAALRWLLKNGWLLGSQGQLVNLAAASGSISAMEWLLGKVEVGIRMNWHANETDGFLAATESGFVSVLDWLVDHGYQPLEDGCYYSDASREGHVDVLDWWSRYEGEFGQEEVPDAVMSYLSCDKMHVLDWWLQSGIMTPALFEDNGFYEFLRPFGERGELKMIRWWMETAGTDYHFLMPHVVNGASYTGQMHMLEYYLERCDPMESEDVQYAIMEASRGGQIKVLEWWQHVGGALDSDFVDAFLHQPYHSPKSMLWWTQVFHLNLKMIKRKKVPRLSYSSVLSMHIAFSQGLVPRRIPRTRMKALVTSLCESGKLCHLMYLFRSRVKVAYDAHDALLVASWHKKLSVLNWWKHMGLELVPPTQAEYEKLDMDVKSWWSASGRLTWML